jgi:hypothetical protein
MIESGKMTEQQFISAMGAFSKRLNSGELTGWGLAGFVRHIDKFLTESTKTGLVYLVCENCKAERKVPATARNDYRHCALCSGKLLLADDQAGKKTRDEWRRPKDEDLPTLEQLEAVCNNNAEKNPALARLALAQIEAHAFRGAPRRPVVSPVVNEEREPGCDDAFPF